MKSLKNVADLTGHVGIVYALQVMESPGSTRLFSACYDKTLRVRSTGTDGVRTCIKWSLLMGLGVFVVLCDFVFLSLWVCHLLHMASVPHKYYGVTALNGSCGLTITCLCVGRLGLLPSVTQYSSIYCVVYTVLH